MCPSIGLANGSTQNQLKRSVDVHRITMTNSTLAIRALTCALFALLAIACSPGEGQGRTESGSYSSAVDGARLTISMSPAESEYSPARHGQPIGENVAPLASGLAYIRGPDDHLIVDEEAYLAIDDDTETIWSSKQHAPQWYAIELDQHYLVDRVEMVITQSPPGPTSHEIWLGHGSGPRTFYTRLSDVHTEDGQAVAIPVDPPQNVNEVLILTLKSPSWVAWRELRVYGRQPDTSVPEEKGPQYTVLPLATGLNYPVRVTHAGDGSGRIFVVEQTGRIRIVKEGFPSNGPFLDISDRVSCCEGERGMFGLAFPPSYPDSRRFYLSYSNSDGATIISRFTTTDDPNIADRNSEEILLTIDQPHVNHNGGHLEFGPHDNLLYIGSGDGGLPRDPENNGQSTDTLLGKLLRIDVESGDSAYGIPASNPFVETEGLRPEIWAYGLRNPWGFSFDSRSGDLYLPDTGNYKREELNYLPATGRAGHNLGWPVLEGTICFEHDVLTCSADGLTLPVADYDHTHGCAVVGGAVYSGDAYPLLQGNFVFADYCTGKIWALSRLEKKKSPGNQIGWHSSLLAMAGMPISSVGSDEEGNTYFTGHAEKAGVLFILTEK